MLEAIKEDFERPVGLILPRHLDPDRGRPPAGSLMSHADWTLSEWIANFRLVSHLRRRRQKSLLIGNTPG